MLHRSVLWLGIAALCACLLGPSASFASVKCQCNDGTITHDMSSDYDDGEEELDDSCNDACSGSGGGRLWKPESDEDGGDSTIERERRRPHPRR